MTEPFAQQVRDVISLAEEEARGMNHGYIGTEHLLLALVQDETGVAALVLRSFGVEAPAVRREIEKLVQFGQGTIHPHPLPLTPRAKQAIAFAVQQVQYLKLKHIDVEHLLLGLLHEPDGLAGQALRNLGLKLNQLAREVLKIRIQQLTLVERAVRPVQATTKKKMKMREELLAHLTDIYDDELVRFKDSAKAMEATQKRFGDPAELSRELQSSQPATETVGYHVERWFGWRAPESAARYMLRMATHSFVLIAAICLVPVVMGIVNHWNVGQWKTLRPAAAALLVTPIIQFLIGLLYFKMRDSLHGVFGSRRSLFKVGLLDVMIALSVIFAGVSFIALSYWDLNVLAQIWLPICGAAMAVAAMFFLRAQFSGPGEISHAIWDCLPIE